jgi:hypothetical protein
MEALDAASLEGTREKFAAVRRQEEEAEHGTNVTLAFQLPNGEQLEQRFAAGVTVAWVKAQLEAAVGASMPAERQRLSSGGKTLIGARTHFFV